MFFLPQRPYMPLGSLREQLTFPDSYAGTAAKGTLADLPGEGGGSAARRHSGSGGGDSDSGEEDEGALPARAVGSGSGRRLPVVRSGPAAAGYRRVASGKGLAASAAGAGAAEAPDSARLGASAASDAELRELLATVCLPSLLPRQAGGAQGFRVCWDATGLHFRSHSFCLPHPRCLALQGGRLGCGGGLGAHAVAGGAAARIVCAPAAPQARGGVSG